MLRRHFLPFAVGCAILAACVLARPVAAETAAQLLPPTTVAYVEVAAPSDLVESVFDHPLRPRIEATPAFLNLRKNPEYAKFLLGVKLVEFKLGKPWRQAVESLAGQGLAAGFDAETEGVVLIARAKDAKFAVKVRDAALEMARGDAKQGEDDPVEHVEYRGVDAYKIENAAFAVYKDWVIVTSEPELGRFVLDRLLGDSAPTLAEQDTFAVAAKERQSQGDVWSYFDIAAIRASGAAEELYRGKADNFAGELAAGGVLAVLKEASHLAASLAIEDEQIRVAVNSPFDAAWLGEGRQYFFGPQAKGRIPASLQVDGQIGSIRAHRDIAELWLRVPDLFDDRHQAELAKGESDISTLLGGRSFGEEILGSLGPEVQIVVAQQDYEAREVPTPEVQLPAFAAVFPLKDADESERVFKIAFQQGVGFANIMGSSIGYPPLLLDMKSADGISSISANYLYGDLTPNPDDPSAARGARMPANFAPAMTFAKEHLIVASTAQLAEKLAHRLTEGSSASEKSDRTVNTLAKVQAAPLRAILAANREHLINRNMLDEGNSREEAEKQIAGLLTLLEWIDAGELELAHDDQSLTLELAVTLEHE